MNFRQCNLRATAFPTRSGRSPARVERLAVIHKESLMLKTITATYASAAALKNAVDELVNADIPREDIYHDDTQLQVKVSVPEVGVESVKELLQRHEPTQVS